MKTAAVLIIAIVAQAAGNVFLTRGMKAVAATASEGGGLMNMVSQSLHAALQAARSPEVWVGTLLLIVFFALYSAALSWADLSFVLPATAISFVITTVGAKLYLKEEISPMRWAGIVLVCAGVALISLPS